MPRFQSTHPGGVRHMRGNLIVCALIFQSTHPGGVRLRQMLRKRSSMLNFNPRTRVGCDEPNADDSNMPTISIHAPGWGATYRYGVGRSKPGDFNPRTRVGCDPLLHAIFHPFAAISIHAPGWGATSRGRKSSPRLRNFNPRTRVGCDDNRQLEPTNLCISIHAPGWGATLASPRERRYESISIHAPGWGATNWR